MKEVSVRKTGLSLFLSILLLGNPLPLYIHSPSHPQGSILATPTVVGKAAALSSILMHLENLMIHLESGKVPEQFSTPAPEGLNILADITYRPGVIAVIPFHWEGKNHTAILSDKSNPFVFPEKFNGAIQEQDISRYRVQWVAHEAKNAPATVRVKLLKALLQHSGRPAGKMDSMNGLSIAEFINEEAGARKKSVADAIQAKRAFSALDELTRANPDKIKRFQTDKTVKFFFQDLIVPDRTATLITQQLAEASPKVRETIQRHFDYFGHHRDQETEIAKSLRASVREIYNTAMEKLRANHPDLPTDIQIDIEPLDSPQEILVNGGAGTVVGIYKGCKEPGNLLHSFYILYGPKTTLICPTRSGLKEFIYHAHNGIWVDNRTRFDPKRMEKGKGKTLADGGKESQKPNWWKRYVRERLSSNKVRYTESPVYITNEVLLGAEAKEGARANGGILQESMRPEMAHALGRLVQAAGGDYHYDGKRLYAGSRDIVSDVRQGASANLPSEVPVEAAPLPEEKSAPLALQDIPSITLERHLPSLGFSEDVQHVLLELLEETKIMQRNLGLIPGEKIDVTNETGDVQAVIDVVGHEQTIRRLQKRGPDGRAPVRAAISEEPTYVLVSENTLSERDGKVHFYYEKNRKLKPGEAEIETSFVPIPSGKGVYVAFDPLDGSSKVDTNGCVGFTGAIYENQLIKVDPIDIKAILQGSRDANGVFQKEKAVALFQEELKKREKEALKAYIRENLRTSFVVLYGPVTTLIMSTQKGVYVYTLRGDQFVLWSRQPIRIPEEGPTLAVGGVMEVQPPAIRHHIRGEYANGKTCGYGGSMCGDVFKALLRGGLFAYPILLSDKKDREKNGTFNLDGKLRGLVEATIVADIIEKAGGAAFTITDQGIVSPVDRASKKAIEKIPPVLGSRAQVERFILAVVKDLRRIAWGRHAKNRSGKAARNILQVTLKNLRNGNSFMRRALIEALTDYPTTTTDDTTAGQGAGPQISPSQLVAIAI